MSKNEDIKLFIAQKGYSTKSELQSEFSDNNGEILDMNLTFLTERDSVRRVEFKGPAGTDELFYILPE